MLDSGQIPRASNLSMRRFESRDKLVFAQPSRNSLCACFYNLNYDHAGEKTRKINESSRINGSVVFTADDCNKKIASELLSELLFHLSSALSLSLSLLVVDNSEIFREFLRTE